jgi:hypothetical protein
MAEYEVLADAIAVHDKTLVAATADEVSFRRDPKAIEVLSDGAAAIYFSVDGTPPTVGGSHCYKMLPYPSSRVVQHNGEHPVRLISAGTPTYSVQVA